MKKSFLMAFFLISPLIAMNDNSKNTANTQNHTNEGQVSIPQPSCFDIITSRLNCALRWLTIDEITTKDDEDDESSILLDDTSANWK
jgi:hypothetical protein